MQDATNRRIVDALANMTRSGEPIDGVAYEQDGQDAVQVLDRLISEAREARRIESTYLERAKVIAQELGKQGVEAEDVDELIEEVSLAQASEFVGHEELHQQIFFLLRNGISEEGVRRDATIRSKANKRIDVRQLFERTDDSGPEL